jgi:hypothetical protein
LLGSDWALCGLTHPVLLSAWQSRAVEEVFLLLGGPLWWPLLQQAPELIIDAREEAETAPYDRVAERMPAMIQAG